MPLLLPDLPSALPPTPRAAELYSLMLDQAVAPDGALYCQVGGRLGALTAAVTWHSPKRLLPPWRCCYLRVCV
jgi:hypothetical protein